MLTLEIVTRSGRELLEEGLTEVVFRRREERFVQGSEVAILSGHAPMLMQASGGRLRWKDKKAVIHDRDVAPGLVEVLDNHVLVVTDAAASQDG